MMPVLALLRMCANKLLLTYERTHNKHLANNRLRTKA